MTRAVIFLATPHNGANIASFVAALTRVLRQTDAITDLASNSAPLRDQETWYLNQSQNLGIRTRSYYETRETKPVGLVVDRSSAGPHVACAAIIGVGVNPRYGDRVSELIIGDGCQAVEVGRAKRVLLLHNSTNNCLKTPDKPPQPPHNNTVKHMFYTQGGVCQK